MFRFLLFPIFSTLPACEALAEDHGVFCAGNHIEVDARANDEMRLQRGACTLGRFPSRSDAEAFASKNLGGLRASCACR